MSQPGNEGCSNCGLHFIQLSRAGVGHTCGRLCHAHRLHLSSHFRYIFVLVDGFKFSGCLPYFIIILDFRIVFDSTLNIEWSTRKRTGSLAKTTCMAFFHHYHQQQNDSDNYYYYCLMHNAIFNAIHYTVTILSNIYNNNPGYCWKRTEHQDGLVSSFSAYNLNLNHTEIITLLYCTFNFIFNIKMCFLGSPFTLESCYFCCYYSKSPRGF